MKIGYSLLIDQFVDADRMEKADCDVLRICCPVCLCRVVNVSEDSEAVFKHAFTLAGRGHESCESRAEEFTEEYRDLHNLEARKRRVKFLKWEVFRELLGKDPLARYEEHPVETLGKMKLQGALVWLPSWHWGFLTSTPRARLADPIDFSASAERYLRRTEANLSQVPSSGYVRQVQIQIAFDLMQYLLTEEGRDDDYQWLFVHVFCICIQRWIGGCALGIGDEVKNDLECEENGELVAAARILASSSIDLISGDAETVETAVQNLNEIWTGPPLTAERMPFLMLIASELAGEMTATLYRLPYFSFLEHADRPCRPLAN